MPPFLETLILDGRVTLIAAAILCLEGLALVLLARRRAIALPAVIANALSGLCLVLALRAALLGSGAGAVALWLTLGFVAHLADLFARLRR